MAERGRKKILFLGWLTLGLFPLVLIKLGLYDLWKDGPHGIDHASAAALTGSSCFLAFLLLISLFGRVRSALGSTGAKKLWFSLLPVVLILSLLEAATGTYIRVKFPKQTTYSSDRLSSPIYAGFDWAGEIIRADERMEYQYAPFRLWKAKPMTSPLMNINEEGTRKTIEPPSPPGAQEFRIQVYGGSTVFCIEVPDQFTLPSCIARALAAKLPNRKVVVENLGVPSYVREQEVIWFQERLRTRPKPDLVIFYDGGNDMVYGGWMQLRHTFLASFQKAMKGDDVTLRGLLGGFFYRYTNTGRLLDILRLMPRPPEKPPSAEDLEARAADAAQRYAKLAGEVREQARGGGFAAAFILQPTLYGKLHPTTKEKVFLDYDYLIRPGLDRLNSAFCKQISALESAEANRGYTDLTHLFDETAADVYLDTFHVGPRENERIAAEIVKAVDGQLPK